MSDQDQITSTLLAPTMPEEKNGGSRTITFDEVYQGGESREMIVRWPASGPNWLVLRCAQQESVFLDPALERAARHYATTGHHGSKREDRAATVAAFGVRVLDCDEEKAARNNATARANQTALEEERKAKLAEKKANDEAKKAEAVEKAAERKARAEEGRAEAVERKAKAAQKRAKSEAKRTEVAKQKTKADGMKAEAAEKEKLCQKLDKELRIKRKLAVEDGEDKPEDDKADEDDDDEDEEFDEQGEEGKELSEQLSGYDEMFGWRSGMPEWGSREWHDYKVAELKQHEAQLYKEQLKAFAEARERHAPKR